MTEQQGSAHREGQVRAAGRVTAAARTARLLVCSGFAPIPQPEDTVGEGVADLSLSRSVLTRGLVSARTAQRFDSERHGKLTHRLVEALRGRVKVAFVSGTRYVHSDGGWHEAEGKSDPPDFDDPLWWLAALDTADEIAELGPEDVRGVPATRYSLTIDLVALTGDARGRREETSRTPRSLFRKDTTWRRSVPAQTWLDAEGRVKRMSFIAIPPRRKGAEPFWVVTELSDFGTPVPPEMWPPVTAT